jgi:hypothetical protein
VNHYVLTRKASHVYGPSELTQSSNEPYELTVTSGRHRLSTLRTSSKRNHDTCWGRASQRYKAGRATSFPHTILTPSDLFLLSPPPPLNLPRFQKVKEIRLNCMFVCVCVCQLSHAAGAAGLDVPPLRSTE